MIDRRELFARLTGAFAAVPFVGRLVGAEPEPGYARMPLPCDIDGTDWGSVTVFGEPLPPNPRHGTVYVVREDWDAEFNCTQKAMVYDGRIGEWRPLSMPECEIMSAEEIRELRR